MSIAPARNLIAICETQPATAEGVRSILEATQDMRCAWAVPALALAQQLARQSGVDVLLLDKGFGQQPVLSAVADLKRSCPSVGVVVWGPSMSEPEALRYLQAGARGLLRKSASLQVVENCLRAVAQGSSWMEDALIDRGGGLGAAGRSELTAREAQVLELVERGLRNREIAAALGIRPGTVKIHLKHIFEKTGVHGRYSLALKVLRQKEVGAVRGAEVA